MEKPKKNRIARTVQWKVGAPPARIREDRLSPLPDEILSHILSFLPTKNAVGTAVLSRRWKDLWTRVSSLDLDNCSVAYHRPLSTPRWQPQRHLGGKSSQLEQSSEMPERRELEFCRFVDRALSEHKNLDSLRRFRLHLSVRYVKERPNLWLKMELGSGSKLEEIDVKLLGDKGYGPPLPMCLLPEIFYTLKHLKVLKLDLVRIANTLDGSVFLPSLKILQLLRVKTVDIESLSRLLCGCPSLETFHLVDIFNDRDIIIASLPCLKNLRLIKCMMCSIGIEAPSLEHLHLEAVYVKLQFLGSGQLSCLESARVDIGGSRKDWFSDHYMIGFLNQISNAKEMNLSWQSLLPLARLNDVQLPVFPNLRHLTVHAVGIGCILHSLLNSAPKLQSLVLGLIRDNVSVKWESEPACTPKCFLSSLEEIEIKNLVADEDDMKITAYLLKVGAGLKQVNVRVHEDEDDFEQIDRGKLASLLQLPRGSSACEVRVLLRNGEIHIDDSDDEDEDDDFDYSDDEEDDFDCSDDGSETDESCLP